MKKYLAAGGVAVVAFAFAASAAQLVVDGNTIQVGQDTDLTCAEAVNVVAWGYNDHLNQGPVSNVTLKAEGNECDGEFLYVTLTDTSGAAIRPAVVVRDFDEKGDDAFTVDLTNGAGAAAGVPGGSIGGIRIGIDQGF
jgi:hypothetical protein